MEKQMLRSVMDRLKRTGRLLECEVPVDPKFELGAVLSYYNNEAPILFKNVKGYQMPVLGGIYGNREIIYDLIGATPETRMAMLMNAIANPQPVKLLANGPVKENIITKNIDIKKMFPVPTSNELDSSCFLTSGMLVLKDTETGKVHMAVRRFQVNRGNSINALISGASPHLRAMIADCAKNGKPIECAVVLGYDAPYLLASQISSSKYGLDKYEVDSALRGEPLEVVKCHTIDLEVPAYAEIVLEGTINPGNVGQEGPFAELMGYYGEVAPVPLMDIKCVMHRNNAIFQHAYPCREEHLAYGILREVEIYAALAGIVDVKDVNLTLGGGCRLHAAVSIKKRAEGDAKSAILTTLGAYKDIKHVMIVDDDVDIFDPMDLEFALASRVQASKDMIVIPGALGSPLEASHMERGVTDKVGVDATKPLHDPNHYYDRAVLPGFDKNFDITKYSIR